ncbi:MAG: hypothetical protein MJ134_01840 [Lachnospiraceae bacterium]|nr:hypothetical protein [Lachnospiraceae bacterium]
MTHLIEHTKVGFCWWDVPTFLVLALVVGVFVYNSIKLNKKKSELEDQLEELEKSTI